MSSCQSTGEEMRTSARLFVVGGVSSFLLAGCGEAIAPAPKARPVRTISVQHRIIAESLTLLGHIRAQEEVNLAFRIDGRLIERMVGIGDWVEAGQIVARLEPQNEQNNLRAAEADLAVAQTALSLAIKAEAREKDLLAKGVGTRVRYTDAVHQLQTSEAQLDSAKARLRAAEDRVGYTELRANFAGPIVGKGAEAGEVVRAGQMVLQIAAEFRRDAVFDAPAKLMFLHGIPTDPIIEIALVDNLNIKVEGKIREIAQQPDPVTNTFSIKVALQNPPVAMHLGAAVRGKTSLRTEPVVEIPPSAVMEHKNEPAVWIVDPTTKTVALRTIEVVRFESSRAIVSTGLRDGEFVVVSGAQLLRPGQPVTLLQDIR